MPGTRQRPDRQLTARYVVALSTIAVLAILGYGVERVRRPRDSDAQLIVIAARQRMLGQQITKAALAIASSGSKDQREKYLAELQQSLALLENSHRLLRYGDSAQAIPAEDDPTTLKIFSRLEERLNSLVAAADALSAGVRAGGSLPPAQTDELRSKLLVAESHFMESANELVSQYAQEATAHVRSSDRIELGLTIALLIVLALQGVVVFAPAVRRVRDGIAALEDTQARLSRVAAIVQSSGDAIAATSLDGTIQSWNRGAEVMFGKTAAEMIGRNVSTIVATTITEKLRDALGRAAAGETATPFDAAARGPRGRHLDISLMMSPITASDGRVTAVAVIGRDITDRVQAQKMKSDFVSFVSHQLRTPLAGIKWMLELVSASPELSEDASEYVADARESADRLVALVNDLLDVSRLEEGRLAVAPQSVQLEEVTQSLLAELDGLVRQKSIDLTFNMESAIPPVHVDLKLIRQALANLISNAVKYTPDGGQIALAIEHDAGTVRWKIRDSGIGIPVASQARLFEKFFRADNALVIETEGTGLGLYLVRLIVTQFGGGVSCESEEGRGATFVVTLPPQKVAA
jgi:PAS domain S-box-containing protein